MRPDEQRDRIAAALAEIPTGPCMVHADPEDCDSDCAPDPAWFLRDWVLVCGWERIEPGSDEDYVATVASKGAASWSVQGLLRLAVADRS